MHEDVLFSGALYSINIRLTIALITSSPIHKDNIQCMRSCKEIVHSS